MTDKITTDKKINEVKSDADYKIAIEKCDSLSGPAKVGCAEEANVSADRLYSQELLIKSVELNR